MGSEVAHITAEAIIEQMNSLYPLMFDEKQDAWAKRDTRNRFVQYQHMLSNRDIDHYQTSKGRWKLGIRPE